MNTRKLFRLLLLGSLLATPCYARKEIAHVRNVDDVILEIKWVEDDWIASDVDHKFGSAREVRLIPVVREPDPSPFDPRTEVIVTTETITADEVRYVKTKRAMTQAELNEIAALDRMSDLAPAMTNNVKTLVAGTDLDRAALRTTLLWLLSERGITE